MELTDQQLAHVLAALRDTGQRPRRHASLRGRRAAAHERGGRPTLRTALDRSRREDRLHRCRDLSRLVLGKRSLRRVVHHVSADTPLKAAKAGRLQAAKGRLVDDEEDNEEEMAEEVAEFAEGIVILAAMKGLVPDLYDPDQERYSP